MRMTLEERRKRKQERRAAEAGIPAPPKPTRMEDVHIPKIMDPEPSIFPPRLRLTLQYYLDNEPRDPERAAKKGGMDILEFKKHLHSPGVRLWLKEQEDLIDEKMAELRAKARMLTQDHLDAATVQVLESKETPHPQKVRMIEVGYRRFGMLKDRVEATGAGGAPLAFQLVRIGSKKESDGPDSDTSSL
jgi:hypothetical protein